MLEQVAYACLMQIPDHYGILTAGQEAEVSYKLTVGDEKSTLSLGLMSKLN